MKKAEEQSGFVLISVLWILAILSVMAMGFGRRAMLDRRMAWYSLDYAEAMQMARGAAERAIVELNNKRINDVLDDKGGYTSYGQPWSRHENLLSGKYFSASGTKGLKDDVCEYQIYDDGGKVSINHAPEAILTELDGLDFGLVLKMMARRVSTSSDNDTLRFLTIEEVREMAGSRISDDEWYGKRPGEGLRDALTVWGDPLGLINVNTASRKVLEAIPGLDRGLLEGILDYRAGADGTLGTNDDQGFVTLGEIPEVLHMSDKSIDALKTYCKTNSFLFTVEARATRRKGKIQALCTVTVNTSLEMGGQVLQWREGPDGS